jgi:multisubunit Na+/H+ antiporter MnhB subunit
MTFQSNNIGSWLAIIFAFIMIANSANMVSTHQDPQGSFVGGVALLLLMIAYKTAKLRRYKKNRYSDFFVFLEVTLLGCVAYLYLGVNSEWLKKTIANDPFSIILLPLVSIGFYLYVALWPKSESKEIEENKEEVTPKKKKSRKIDIPDFGQTPIYEKFVDYDDNPFLLNEKKPKERKSKVLSYDQIYEIIANEIDAGDIDKGVWTRILVENDGNETKTKIIYIREMFKKIKSEIDSV